MRKKYSTDKRAVSTGTANADSGPRDFDCFDLETPINDAVRLADLSEMVMDGMFSASSRLPNDGGYRVTQKELERLSFVIFKTGDAIVAIRKQWDADFEAYRSERGGAV